MQSARLLAARDVIVRFGATHALDGVDFDLHAGEVHAVVGENGAGKSTLLRVLAGTLRPTSGMLLSRLGVRSAWVPQDADLPGDATPESWIFLGREICGAFGWLRRGQMRVQAAAALRAVGSDVKPLATLGGLGAPQRKQVQLARAVSQAPDALLVDEPTAVLGYNETRDLFRVLRELRNRGAGILYVSHRLDEVLAIADRVTVLRDGRRVSTDPVSGVDVPTLVQRMVGREFQQTMRTSQSMNAPCLRVADLAVAQVRGFSLTVNRGEIVGLAGLMGAGRSEVLEAIAGLRRPQAGSIACVASAVLVPEDRVTKGLVATLRLRENLFLPADDWRLSLPRERRVAQLWIDRLGIRTTNTEASIDTLSGGNQQKLLLARALHRRPSLLLLDEPTAGVDVGAKAEIHEIIRQLAAAGTAIVLASSDLPELLILCDRILALRQGRLAGSLDAANASEPQLAALLTGAEHAIDRSS